MTNTIGPDISFYQDDPSTTFTPDFSKMAWVILRAGQNTWIDRDFKRNWKEAKKAGIPRGAYWFFDSRVDPKKQAQLFVSAFDGDFGELPLFGDFEDIYNGPFKGWKNWYDFLEEVKRLVPGSVEIGVYTGYYYWKENTLGLFGGIPAASLEYFKQYPLWIANYGLQSPLIPRPWTTWMFWQYTDNGDGTLYGVESLNIDLNEYNGDAQSFEKRFGVKLNQPPIPPSDGQGVPTMPNTVAKYKFERAGTAGAALRNAPRASGVLKPYPLIPSTLITSAGYITDGTLVKGDEIVTLAEDIIVAGNTIGLKGDKWLHVIEVGGYVVDGYTAIVHKGVSQGTLEELVVDSIPTNPNPTPTPSPVSVQKVSVAITPDNKLQVIIETKLPVHEVWINNVKYNPAS